MPPPADGPRPTFRSPCPIASALDLVGDRWTLVILRTVLAGRRRYGDLLAIPERISTNILAARLAEMEANGLLTRRPYRHAPTRYEYLPTRKGAALLPVLQDLARWAEGQIPDRWPLPDWFVSAVPDDYPEPDAVRAEPR
ncbi:MAG: helix-turn-helix domain-containing protein [Amaricoccus sp.]